ncbi:unnamed protein product [Boreogadus saida]
MTSRSSASFSCSQRKTTEKDTREAIRSVVGSLPKIDQLKPEREQALQSFVGGRDVVALLPTGLGKTAAGAGADPFTAGRKLHTPLHNACANCSARIAEGLLLRGARADVENCAGYTPMDCLLQVVEDYPAQQPEVIARSLLNHGAKLASPKVLKHCLLSPATLEVLLNTYTVIPPCGWMEALSSDVYKEHQAFFDRVRLLSGQPRSLQHLCRGVVRRYLGAACHSAVGGLPVPGALKDYLLLCNDGTLR